MANDAIDYIGDEIMMFSVPVAKVVGINKAIFLHNLAYWIRNNKKSDSDKGVNTHTKDGRVWTYNTLESYSRHFGFWSVDQVRYIIDGLVKDGVIIKGNYNKNKYDRTLWLAFSQEHDWV